MKTTTSNPIRLVLAALVLSCALATQGAWAYTDASQPCSLLGGSLTEYVKANNVYPSSGSTTVCRNPTSNGWVEGDIDVTSALSSSQTFQLYGAQGNSGIILPTSTSDFGWVYVSVQALGTADFNVINMHQTPGVCTATYSNLSSFTHYTTITTGIVEETGGSTCTAVSANDPLTWETDNDNGTCTM